MSLKYLVLFVYLVCNLSLTLSSNTNITSSECNNVSPNFTNTNADSYYYEIALGTSSYTQQAFDLSPNGSFCVRKLYLLLLRGNKFALAMCFRERKQFVVFIFCLNRIKCCISVFLLSNEIFK